MSNRRQIDCLDKGFVALVDYMGSDQRIVDAARVSYQAGTKVTQSDRHLIRYLLRNGHTSPLEKVRFEFHIKTPIFVARQWMRHRMASINECSARYSVMPDEFYVPDPLRKQSNSNRQGSSDEVVTSFPVDYGDGVSDSLNPQEVMKNHFEESYALYEDLLEEGAARELARTVLPVSLYTEFYWTIDLWNLMHFLRLRLDPHAQYEIRIYGEAILQLIKDHCELGFALEAFQDYVLDKPSISKYELECIRDLICYSSSTSSAPGCTSSEQRDHLRWLVQVHPEMSKREKTETQLFKLLGLDK